LEAKDILRGSSIHPQGNYSWVTLVSAAARGKARTSGGGMVASNVVQTVKYPIVWFQEVTLENHTFQLLFVTRLNFDGLGQAIL
jgi:hypothetical protein